VEEGVADSVVLRAAYFSIGRAIARRCAGQGDIAGAVLDDRRDRVYGIEQSIVEYRVFVFVLLSVQCSRRRNTSIYIIIQNSTSNNGTFGLNIHYAIYAAVAIA